MTFIDKVKFRINNSALSARNIFKAGFHSSFQSTLERSNSYRKNNTGSFDPSGVALMLKNLGLYTQKDYQNKHSSIGIRNRREGVFN